MPTKITIIAVAISALIFLIDLATPTGIASGIPYIAVVLFSLWAERQSFIFASAGAATALTIIGVFLSPPGAPFWIVALNRGLTLLVIWVTALLILEKQITENRRKQEVQQAFAVLELRVQERTTALTQANLKLREQMTQIDLKNKALQEFTFIASHDLQEPLRKIQTFGGMLKRKCAEPFDDQARDYLERMIKAAERMQELIRALLGYSLTERATGPFRRLALNDLMEEVLDDLAVTIQKVDALIRIGDLPVIHADPIQMRELFQNLIENALKFRRNKPVIELETLACDETCCRIAVKDNGIGFDAQHAEQIFKPFKRLHGRGEYRGTGMGLAICRKVVERHGGGITATGIPGGGATFVVTLPRKAPAGSGQDPGCIEAA